MTMQTKKVLNIAISDTTVDELLPIMTHGVVVTPNADHLVLLQSDGDFYRAYREADFTLLDSQVIYLIYKIIGKPFKEKISGSDLFPKYCEYYRNDPSIKIFIIGGMNDVAVSVQALLNTRYQRTMVVGAVSPSDGFENKEMECRSLVDMINRSEANVLVIGVGAPKQEKWVHRYKPDLKKINLCMCIGATLDFMAGTQKRAPKALQITGLEWAYRLVRDPRRLFYRYIVRDMKIFYYLLCDVLNLYSDPFAGRK